MEVSVEEGGAPIYLRNAWYAASWAEDLADEPMPKVLLGEEIILYRTADGTATALGNRCPHRFVELHRGKIVGDNIQCPYHGLQFGPSGACAHNPHGGHRPAAAHVKSYPLVERHGLIWLWMGPAEKADPALIPDCSIVEDSDRAVVHGILHIKGDYQLYTDNLMDLSHTEYVHSFQEANSLDRSVSSVERQGDSVLFIREFPEEPAVGPLHTKFCEALGGKAGDIVKISQTVHWTAPANMLFSVTQTRGDRQANFSALHIAAPTRPGECQLLWSGIRNFSLDDRKEDEYLQTTLERVISTEDIPPIESQQTYIRNRPFMSLKPVLLPTDGAPVLARRILEKMIQDEQAAMEDVPDIRAA